MTPESAAASPAYWTPTMNPRTDFDPYTDPRMQLRPPTAAERAEQLVRDHPWGSVFAAAAVGMALGKMSRSGGVTGTVIGAVAGYVGRAAVRTAIARGVAEVLSHAEEP